ncbi:response regulator [bacterium]|nr:response regulator [bacterium]
MFSPTRPRTIAFLGLANAAILLAGAAGAGPHPYQVYTDANGLPSSSVLGVSQDPDGYMWFATRNGLTRYDGAEWYDVVQENDSFGRGCRDVASDGTGRLWTVSLWGSPVVWWRGDDGWNKLEPQAFPNPGADLKFAVGDSRDSPGPVVLGALADSVLWWRGGEWEVLRAEGPTHQINDVDILDGTLLVATSRGLLTAGPRGALVPLGAVGVPTGPVLATCRAREGGAVWLVGETWIGRLADGRCEVLADGLRIELEQGTFGVAAVAEPAGGIYFGGTNEVFSFHPRFGLERLLITDRMAGDGATDLFLDREGTVWLANMRGVCKLADRAITSYDHHEGLFADEVCAVLHRRDGVTVLGHPGGLTVLSDPPVRIALPDGDERVMDLAEDAVGRVWLAATKRGIGRIEGNGVVWVWPLEDQMGTAFTLHFDRTGRLWIGSANGLLRTTAAGLEEVVLPGTSDVRHLTIRRIEEAHDGDLLVATYRRGVYRIAPDGIRSWQDRREDLGSNVYAVHETRDGRLLAGTLSGLYEARGDSLVKSVAPRVDRPIYALRTDPDGRLWVATDNGVRVWRDGELITLTAREGLIGGECNRDGLQFDAAGRMWVGMDHGVSVCDLDLRTPSTVPPLVEFRSLEVNGRALSPLGDLGIAAPVDLMVVGFRGLSFRDEASLRFRTWLEGFEPAWQDPVVVPGRSLRYTNVPPGRYRFHLQAIRNDGAASAAITTDWIRITPRLRDRAAFRAALVALTLVALWLVVSSLKNRQYTRRLAAEVAARTRELRASEAEVRRESARLAATLGSIADGLIGLDGDRVALINPAACDIIGVAAADAVGRSLGTLLPGLAARLEGAAVGTADRGEVRITPLAAPAAPSRLIDFSLAPLRIEGADSPGRVIAFRDVTDRARTEQERQRAQKLESLGALAGGIAHDFNNLLTVVVGNVSLVEETAALQPAQRENLLRARRAMERASSLTRQLLTFARGGAPVRESLAVDRILESVAALAFSGSAATCRLDIAGDLWTIEADPDQIEQVFSNLMINAAQAMPDGGSLRVQARNDVQADADGALRRMVVLTFRDEGEGVAPDDLDRIFEPYFSTKERGSGLGLSIVYSIVNRHGGDIEVASAPGRGTVFTVRLPAADALAAGASLPTGALPEPGGRILVLDDEEDLRDLLAGLLGTFGIGCVTCGRGEDAVARFAAAQAAGEPFRAVILDLTVPGGLGGKDVLPRLRRLNPRIRAIVVSGYSHDDVMSDCTAYGFDAALAKPFSRDELATVLRRVFAADRSPARRDGEAPRAD